MMEMSHDEFIKWQMYFAARPVGWREDDRTMKLLQVQGVKEEGSKIFQSLALMKFHGGQARAAQASIGEKLQGSAMFANMLAASGGERIPL